MEEKPNNNSSGAAPESYLKRRRLLTIAIVLFPISWGLYAFCWASWFEPIRSEEPLRHFLEWILLLASGIAAAFYACRARSFGWLARFIDWLGSPRIERRAVKAGIWVVTALALFYAEEDWRGNRAWNSYRKQLEANGARLDLAAFVPKPIPDEENFAATAVVKSWFVEVNRAVVTNTTERFTNNWDDDYAKLTMIYPDGVQDMKSRHFMDLAECATIFEAIRSGQTNVTRKPEMGDRDLAARAAVAPAVLAALKTNETALGELQAASQRPGCRYPVIYDLENPWGIFLPHLINVRNACQRLQLRACAELAAGRSEDALADVKLMLYLADSVKDEPFLISYLLRAASVQMAIQPVWEGLAERAWSDRQLQELEARFGRYNFAADAAASLDSERAMGICFADAIKKRGLGFLIELIGPGQPTDRDKRMADMAGVIVPSGWYGREKVNYCRLYQERIAGGFDPASKRILPAQIDADENKVSQELESGSFGKTCNSFLHHRVIALAALFKVVTLAQKAAAAQTAANQAALACALERYRLGNGSFPGTLDALAPKFISQLPCDVINGGPMKYRRTDDGQFILYSVGWNEKDDGGTPGKKLFDEENGDWIWEYPKL